MSIGASIKCPFGASVRLAVVPAHLRPFGSPIGATYVVAIPLTFRRSYGHSDTSS